MKLIISTLILLSSISVFAGNCDKTIKQAIESLAKVNGRGDKVLTIEKQSPSRVFGLSVDNYYVETTGAPYKVKATDDGVTAGQCEVLGLGYTIVID